MIRPGKRVFFWGLASIAVGAVVAGYSWLVNSYETSLANTPSPSFNDEIILPPKDEPDGRLLRLRKASDRQTIPPENVGIGWPTLLGPDGDCRSPERGLDLNWPAEGPFEKWRVPVGTGYSSPVVLGGSVVLLHRKEDREIVECFDAETGTSRWAASWPAEYECPFSHSSGPYSAPVLEPGRVYAIGAAGRLVALDIRDGAELWHRDLNRDYEVVPEVWPVSASPLLDGDRLIVNVGGRKTGAGVVGLDKNTGETLWTATNDGASCSTPRAATFHGRRMALVWTADALVALRPSDGELFWRIPFAARNYEAAHGTSPLIAGDVVLVSAYQLGNLCVRVLPDGSHKELWRDKRTLLDSQYNSLIYVDGSVCGYSAVRCSLRCLDLLTGELRWQWRSKILHGNLIAVDGRYLCFGDKGRLASLAIAADGVRLIAMTERPLIARPSLSYPALHNGLLYLRNEEELLAIDLRRTAAGGQDGPTE